MITEYAPVSPSYTFHEPAYALGANRNGISGRGIIAEVSSVTGVPVAEIVGRSRIKIFVFARHWAMARIREETNLSLNQIGRLFGGLDHTSVMYGIKKWKEKWSKE